MVAKKRSTDADLFPAHLDIVPLDEEFFTAEEQSFVQEGRDDIATGRTFSLEEVKEFLLGPQGRQSPSLG